MIAQCASIVLLLTACSSNLPPEQPTLADPVSMLSAGGCYQAECRNDKAVLAMCVSSDDATEAPLKIEVFWAQEGSVRQRIFESQRAFDEDAVRLLIPLQLDCSRRDYRLELSAVSRKTRLSDSVASACAEPLERCGRP